MTKYKVKSNLKHDGRDYKKNDFVVLNKEQADQLLKDKVVVRTNEAIKEDERESPQPAVNNVKHAGDNKDGEIKIEPGKIEQPKIGEDDDEPVKSKFKVLKALEYPRGTAHKVDSIIELTDEEVGKFAKGLIEEVEDNL